MKPAELRLIRFTLAVIWLVTGVVSLWIYPRQDSLTLIARTGLHGNWALAALYLGAGLDIVMGVLTLFARNRLLWLLQALLTIAYTLILTLWLPEFWQHPFGPLLKNLPILVLLWLLYTHENDDAP